MMRQVVLDTETTGLEPEQGHRVIEIGGVEVIGRRLTGRRFHCYVDPERSIDDAAIEIHGITSDALIGKPKFGAVVSEFLEFVRGAELVIHNAAFDVSFLNYELSLLDPPTSIERLCTITDSLAIARDKHPGQKNSLDALCRRYGVDNSQRDLHGALLDAEILADVYLLMTGGQGALFATEQEEAVQRGTHTMFQRLPEDRPRVRIVFARADELALHEQQLDALDKQADGGSVWRRIATPA
jgi:DNA polymerase-3 subunit epsilon